MIPNFINDLSFEENRIGFLDARKNNCIDEYTSFIKNECKNAKNKMKKLKTASFETIQMIASAYNSSNEEEKILKSAKAKPETFHVNQPSGSSAQIHPQSSVFIDSATNNQSIFSLGLVQPQSKSNLQKTSIFSQNMCPPQNKQPAHSTCSSIFGAHINSFEQNTTPSSIPFQNTVFSGDT